MSVDCTKCKQFGVGCDPADDSYCQPCEDFEPVPEQGREAEEVAK